MEKKQQKEIIIMVVGAIVLAVVLAGNLIKPKPKTVSPPAGAAAQTVLQKIAPMAAPEKVGPGKALSESGMSWGRDPFVLVETGAGVTAEENVSNLTLEGTTAGVGIRPSAIINDEIVKEGSKIGKFTVLSIIKNKVIVTDGKDETELIIDR